jgi:conjugal transfer mating pair stabilization protein TraN
MNIFGKKLKMNNHPIGKVILAILVFMLSTPLESKAMRSRIAAIRTQQTLQQAEALAQLATQAAEKGDFKTSQQKLAEIETLSQQMFGGSIQSSETIKEAKRVCAETESAAIKAAAEKVEAAKQAKEKEIAIRIALEKEAALKQIARRQEDERKAETRRQQLSVAPENQVRAQQSVPHTPQTETHQAGQSFGSSLLGSVISAAKSTNPHDIPRFQTDKPKEAFLNAETLGDAALAESSTNEIAQHLHTQAKDRKTFKIDTNTDPLFLEANRVITDPQKALNEEIIATSDSGEDVSEEIKTCEEGGDEYSQSCSKRLEIVLKITPEIRTPYRYCPPPGHPREKFQRHGFNSGYITVYEKCGGCATAESVTAKKVELASEKWIDGCAVLEDHTEKGLCRYESKTTSPQNETKTIQGEPVTRDHFEEHYRYTCFKAPPTPNSCAGLREKGCFQIGSDCKEKVGDVCVLWEQTYSCPSGKKSLKSYRASNKENPFCLTGNCADTSYEANNEMMNSMSHLYALREAQNDLREFKVIFKGTHRWCTRNCLGFRDCCGDGKGWGVTLHLSDCDAKEIELRTLRDKNLCVQMGTYCAERDAIFDSCLRKKTTFCCYGTKMARLIQQNGRAQLGIGFGTPESPNCEGLSPEQLSRIDFSRINFSEVFEDIKNKTVVKGQGQSLAALSAERLQENMTLLTKPRIDQKQLATKQLNAEPLDEKSAQELQKLKEKGL